MAQIVCIDKGTLNAAVNSIDDIVAIHDDDVELTGQGYVNYKIIKVAGKTAKELNTIFNAKRPEQNRAVKVTAGKWCFMEEKEVWKNRDGLWCDLVESPKYSINLVSITDADRTKLSDKLVSVSEKNTLLDKGEEKIHLNVLNKVEVTDLNEAKI